MNHLTKVAFYLFSSTSIFAQDAHPALKDFLSLNDKWNRARLDVTYMSLTEQHPAVQAEVFKNSSEIAARLKSGTAEKTVHIDYFRLISCDKQFAYAAVRTRLDDSNERVKDANSYAENGRQHHSWLYSPKAIKDPFSPLPKANLDVKEENPSRITFPDLMRPWGAVLVQMQEALGDLDAADNAKLEWKFRDQNTLTCKTERNGGIYELTMAKTFNAWVPVEVLGFRDNREKRIRVTLAYKPVELDGSQLPYPKEILVIKELNRDGTYLPYITTRKIVESATLISENEMADWMKLDTAPIIAPEAIARLSKQK